MHTIISSFVEDIFASQVIRVQVISVISRSGGSWASTVPAPVDASISVALLAEPDDSRDTADTVSVPVLESNEQIKEQMKDCVSTVEVLPNTSEGTATDLASHQLVVVPLKR
uniref:Uncharacterized protein n=1 Tax=Glossina pallidipes TaxID=7398 RepID=A0A1A9ZSD7_GLOPL